MTAVAGAAAAVVALTAGCGGSGHPTGPGAAGTRAAGTTTAASSAPGPDNGAAAQQPAEILQRSAQALRDARSVRAVGTVAGGGAPITMDLRLDLDGNCTGTLSESDVGGLQVVKAGQQLWIKPDQAFWQNHGGSAMADAVGDRYLKTTSDDPDFGEVTGLCDLGSLADQLGAADDLTKGATSTVQGRPAVALSRTTDGGTTVTLYVATDGQPVPLRLEQEAGTVDFSEFGTPVPSATPGPDQSVDIDQIQPEASPTTV
ncbi:hypothetical protein [Kitasatospora sp. CB01950]|uniref:hypothetical protein n=1 Tax=Kitasatospora sp. CB01950 TaxID=1703930 RepID=UPI0011612602|nr:hypothetical protein [Kitasatospora sp. CB01950]